MSDDPFSIAVGAGVPAGGRRYSDDDLAEARALYEDDAEISQVEICKRLGMTPGTLSYHARTNGWVRPEGARTHARTGGGDKRARLVARLYRAFERQVGELEARLGERLKETAEGGAAAGEPRPFDDRDARLLSTLAQTLHRLVTLDAAWGARGAGAREAGARGADMRPDGTTDGEPELDEFRRSLAQRLEALIEGGDRSPAGGA